MNANRNDISGRGKRLRAERGGLAAAAAALCLGALAPAIAAPAYDNGETRELVEEMVAAHGGADRFFAARSFKFSIAMYLYTLGINEKRTSYDNWRYYTVTVDPDTSRAYIDVPHENMDGPEAAVTRDQYWRTDYQFDKPFQEGPHMLAWFHYSMIALPFLSQVDGVTMARVEDSTLPYSEKSYPTVRMSFDPGEGKVMEGFMDLIIDPDTHLLAGWGQGSPLALLPGDILPPEMPTLPGRARFVRIVDKHQTVDGLVIPIGYYSNRPDGTLAGSHIVLDASFDEKFDERQLKMPEGARLVHDRNEPQVIFGAQQRREREEAAQQQ